MESIESAGYTAKVVENSDYPGIEIWYQGRCLVLVEQKPDKERQIVIYDMKEDEPKHIIAIESESGI